MGILFRTFLDILLPYTPWFTGLLFLDYLFPSLALYFLSKILRGHIVSHFLRYSLLSLYSTSLSREPYPRLCVGILFRTFLDSLSPSLVVTFFPLLFTFLCSYPLSSSFDLVFLASSHLFPYIEDSAWAYCPALSSILSPFFSFNSSSILLLFLSFLFLRVVYPSLPLFFYFYASVLS